MQPGDLNLNERLQAEGALRESEQRMRLALRSAGLGCWNISAATDLFTTDERFRAIFGLTAESPTYEQCVAAIHPDDRSRIRAAVAAATRIEDPMPYETEYRIVHADGSIHWVLAKGRANFTHARQGRKLVSFDGTIDDITERKRSEQALRDSEERYRTLFTSIDEAFCVIEMIYDAQEVPVDFRLLEVNPAFQKQTGLSEATGRRMSELVPGLEACWFELFGKVAGTGESARFVTVAKGMDSRWFDVCACRVGPPENLRIAVTLNDISERRLAELSLQQSHLALQAHVEELIRFNRVAVGRELRMIELKKELNELSRRHGEVAPYRLDFEQDEKAAHAR